jgi:hypothetical protein
VWDVPPVCPLHKKAMILEVQANLHHIHYKCWQDECPVRWNPITTLYYLESRGDRLWKQRNVA